MVATEPGAGTTATEANDGGTTFGKLRQTLSSSLLTAQDKGKQIMMLNRIFSHLKNGSTCVLYVILGIFYIYTKCPPSTSK